MTTHATSPAVAVPASEVPSTSPAESALADARAAFDDLPPSRTGHVPGVDPYGLAGSA